MISGYKSIKTLIAKVYRDLDITEEDRWVSMIEWTAEALQHIGAYSQFRPKTEDLTVTGFRAHLPCDYYKMTQVSYGGVPLLYGTGSFDKTKANQDGVELKTTASTDTSLPNPGSIRPVYTINDSYIFTNFNGVITLSYLAIPVDEDGFPLIPISAAFDEAIFRYIVTKLYYPEFISGRMPANLYDKLENDWNYKCMAARGEAYMPNVDQLESIKNQWLRLIPDINQHSQFFNELNQRESIKIGK